MKNYLSLNRSERNGLLLLLTLCFIALLAPVFYAQFTTKEAVDFSAFEAELKAFRQQVKEETMPLAPATKLFNFDPNTASETALLQLGISQSVVKTLIKYRTKGGRFFSPEDLKKVYGLKENTYETLLPFIKIEKKSTINKAPKLKEKSSASLSEIKPFPFDPNTISQEELRQLGLSEKTAKIWENFRNKGGRFYEKEDISKIYGLSEKTYLVLAPFIKIEEKKEKEKKEKEKKQEKKEPQEPIQLDVNQASLADWQQLKGIGSYRAKLIVEYREKLGGFVSLDQIASIYNLPDSVFQHIAPQLILSALLKKININTASQKELSTHPYLTYKEAKVIVNYRNQHGKFNTSADLLKLKVLSDNKVENLLPYVNFD